ncbi:unnamed protein product [Malus baccata var. baccata]
MADARRNGFMRFAEQGKRSLRVTACVILSAIQHQRVILLDSQTSNPIPLQKEGKAMVNEGMKDTLSIAYAC